MTKQNRWLLVFTFGLVFLLAGSFGYAQAITITAPAAGTSWCRGQVVNINWNKSGSMASQVKIRLFDSAVTAIVMPIVDSTPNDGSYTWTVPASVSPGNYVIRVRTVDNAVMGDSDVFGIVLCSTPSITVTAPAAGVNWRRGDAKTISWTKSGSMDSQVKIRLFNSTATVKLLDIVNATPNDGSYGWTIPGTLAEGQYVIRVRTVDNAVVDDSPVFNITRLMVGEVVFPPRIEVMRDLEIRGVRYVYNYGGQITARVKCSTSPINQDVAFRLVFPEMVRDGIVNVTKPLNIVAGAERDVFLRALSQNDIPLKGLLTRVIIDPNNQLPETDERNNSFETRLAVLDLSVQTPRSDLEQSKLYLQGGKDYRVKFKIRVRHNLSRTINNVRVKWELQDAGGWVRGCGETFTISSLANGEEWVKQVNQTFGKEGRRNADYPRLREGQNYRIVCTIQNPPSEMFDVNTRNNTSSLSFVFRD